LEPSGRFVFYARNAHGDQVGMGVGYHDREDHDPRLWEFCTRSAYLETCVRAWDEAKSDRPPGHIAARLAAAGLKPS
jgi:hypothetical protein